MIIISPYDCIYCASAPSLHRESTDSLISLKLIPTKISSGGKLVDLVHTEENIKLQNFLHTFSLSKSR